jgi:cold shock CspA family protein
LPIERLRVHALDAAPENRRVSAPLRVHGGAARHHLDHPPASTAAPAVLDNNNNTRNKSMIGRVSKIVGEPKSFGFITGDDGYQYFLHATSLRGAVDRGATDRGAAYTLFATLAVGDEVEFEPWDSERGLRAGNVARISSPSPRI